MTPTKKAAIFLLMIGLEKGQNIINLMDTGEIRAVVSEIRRLKEISPAIQESVWTEFKELGYENTMKPYEVLNLIRFLFHGSRICGGAETDVLQ